MNINSIVFKSLTVLCLSLNFTTLSANRPFILGIAGGSGSGKTTLAQKIHAIFSTNSVIISQDSYYNDLSLLSLEERDKANFDHPESLDFDLLEKHLNALLNDDSVDVPHYNFTTHSRTEETTTVNPCDLIIVEGILLFSQPAITDLCDLKVFVDAEESIRLERRIVRDIAERGRTLEGVIEQFDTTVKPMHDEFVEPSKYTADIIIPSNKTNDRALFMIVTAIDEHLATLKKNAKDYEASAASALLYWNHA